VTEKEPLLAGVVSGRRFAVAEVDGLDRNRWTIWIGISGRVQPEWVDDLGRNGWTISPGIITKLRQGCVFGPASHIVPPPAQSRVNASCEDACHEKERGPCKMC